MGRKGALRAPSAVRGGPRVIAETPSCCSPAEGWALGADPGSRRVIPLGLGVIPLGCREEGTRRHRGCVRASPCLAGFAELAWVCDFPLGHD